MDFWREIAGAAIGAWKDGVKELAFANRGKN